MSNTTSDVVWSVLIGVALVYELIAVALKRWPATLSAKTRRFFQTNTEFGRWTFLVLWLGFAGWFLWHILWQ